MNSLSSSSETKNQSTQNSYLSARQTFVETRRFIQKMEGMGASDFDIFNALSSFFHERGETEISSLMAEAAYHCYQKEDNN